MASLRGQVALITGANTLLAHELALALVADGVHVVLTGSSLARLTEAEARLRAAGGEALTVGAALETLDEAQGLVTTTLETFGRLDLVILVTPFWGGGLIHELAVETWDLVLNVDLRASFLVARAALPHLRAQGRGQLVAIGSDSGLGHYERDGAFGVAMHGLNALMAQIRLENAAAGIRAHVLHPGLIQSQPVDADGHPTLTADRVVASVLEVLRDF